MWPSRFHRLDGPGAVANFQFHNEQAVLAVDHAIHFERDATDAHPNRIHGKALGAEGAPAKCVESFGAEDGFEGSAQNIVGRHAEQILNVGADLADDQVRIGYCEQHAMRLDLPDGVNRQPGAGVRIGKNGMGAHEQRLFRD